MSDHRPAYRTHGRTSDREEAPIRIRNRDVETDVLRQGSESSRDGRLGKSDQ